MPQFCSWAKAYSQAAGSALINLLACLYALVRGLVLAALTPAMTTGLSRSSDSRPGGLALSAVVAAVVASGAAVGADQGCRLGGQHDRPFRGRPGPSEPIPGAASLMAGSQLPTHPGCGTGSRWLNRSGNADAMPLLPWPAKRTEHHEPSTKRISWSPAATSLRSRI